MHPSVSPFGFLGRIFLRTEDERVYAVVRIGFSITALYNLALIWPLREILLANSGSVDLNAAVDLSPMGSVGLFHWFQTPGEIAVLMGMVAVALVLLMLGVVPRLAAALIFVWHLSFIERVPVGLGGWDYILRSISFLVLVSPMGRCWSWRTWRQKEPPKYAQVARYGLLLMQLQVVVIYLQTVAHRLVNPNAYWRNGEFMPYFLMSHNARWPGVWAAEYANVLMLGTYLTMITEVVIPILLLNKRTRLWGILVGVLFHGSITLFTKNVEPFFVTMFMTYLAFLTGGDLDYIQQRLCSRADKKGDPAAQETPSAL